MLQLNLLTTLSIYAKGCCLVMAEHNVKKRKKMEILGKFNTQIKTQIVTKKLVAMTSNLSTSLKERNSLIQRYQLAKFVLESSMFIA
jgi:hypothetical protein